MILSTILRIAKGAATSVSKVAKKAKDGVVKGVKKIDPRNSQKTKEEKKEDKKRDNKKKVIKDTVGNTVKVSVHIVSDLAILAIGLIEDVITFLFGSVIILVLLLATIVPVIASVIMGTLEGVSAVDSSVSTDIGGGGGVYDAASADTYDWWGNKEANMLRLTSDYDKELYQVIMINMDMAQWGKQDSSSDHSWNGSFGVGIAQAEMGAGSSLSVVNYHTDSKEEKQMLINEKWNYVYAPFCLGYSSDKNGPAGDGPVGISWDYPSADVSYEFGNYKIENVNKEWLRDSADKTSGYHGNYNDNQCYAQWTLPGSIKWCYYNTDTYTYNDWRTEAFDRWGVEKNEDNLMKIASCDYYCKHHGHDPIECKHVLEYMLALYCYADQNLNEIYLVDSNGKVAYLEGHDIYRETLSKDFGKASSNRIRLIHDGKEHIFSGTGSDLLGLALLNWAKTENPAGYNKLKEAIEYCEAYAPDWDGNSKTESNLANCVGIFLIGNSFVKYMVDKLGLVFGVNEEVSSDSVDGAETIGDQVIAEAFRCYERKIPIYDWGGTDLESYCDCSGLICALYHKFKHPFFPENISEWGYRTDLMTMPSEVGTYEYLGGLSQEEKIKRVEAARAGDIFHYPGHVDMSDGKGGAIGIGTPGDPVYTKPHESFINNLGSLDGVFHMNPIYVNEDSDTYIKRVADKMVGDKDLSNCSQVLDVVVNGTTAEISTYDKKNGKWTRNTDVLQNVKGYIGSEGLASEKANANEGKSQTPFGAYYLGVNFGGFGVSQSGLKIDWKNVQSKQSYWGTSNNSTHRNQFYTSDKPDQKDDEDLTQYCNNGSYKYAILIEYNYKSPTKGGGSAFFLHVGSSPTAGCVATSEGNMKKVLDWIDKSKKTRILIHKPIDRSKGSSNAEAKNPAKSKVNGKTYGEAVINLGLEYVKAHTPYYSEGGKDLNTGVDCSGLIYALYKAVGYTKAADAMLAHILTLREIGSDFGTYKSLEGASNKEVIAAVKAANPGDFVTVTNPGHVALLVGNGSLDTVEIGDYGQTPSHNTGRFVEGSGYTYFTGGNQPIKGIFYMKQVAIPGTELPKLPTDEVYTADEFTGVVVGWFKRHGFTRYLDGQNDKFTWYREPQSDSLDIPGRTYWKDFVVDKDGYIALAGTEKQKKNGTIMPTPFGAYGKVYDVCVAGNIDVLRPRE